MMRDINDNTKKQVSRILLLMALFNVALVVARLSYTGAITYVFLIWNLLLAWIPYGLSILIGKLDKKVKSNILLLMATALWLLFFPNAPYIMTDLFHLTPRTGIPLYYDLILILSFAWSGLIFGFLSLVKMQRIITRRTNELIGWAFTIISLIAASFGIYLGRYERWNSWDLISQPFGLIKNIADYFLHPIANKNAYIATITLSIFLIISYLTLTIFMKSSSINNKK